MRRGASCPRIGRDAAIGDAVGICNRIGVNHVRIFFFPPSRNRNRILASVAVLALATAGAAGEAALSAPHATLTADVSMPATQGQTAPSFLPSFAPLIARVKPAVVSVKVKIAHQDDSTSQFDNLPPEIQKFFKQFGEPNGAPKNPNSIILAEGSGFFISADGYIVTNYHVAQDSKSVTVTMDNGKVLDAKVVGTDPKRISRC